MLPAILLIRVPPHCRIAIPLPLFLLWPFVPLLVLVMGIVTRRGRELPVAANYFQRVRMAWALFAGFRGLKIDARSKDGVGVYMNFV